MKERKELRFITILYGIAAALVVFGHSHPLHSAYPHSPINWVYQFHMPLFFLIAGILTAYTAPGRKIWPWWKKKALRLLTPYIVLSLAAWLPKTMLGAYMNDDMTISWANLARILLIPREGVWGHFWFIPVYLALELCAAFLWKYLEHTPKVISGGYCLSRCCCTFSPLRRRGLV